MNEVTISLDEYKEVYKAKVTVELFIDYVKRNEYIDKDDCVKFFGIKESEDAGTD